MKPYRIFTVVAALGVAALLAGIWGSRPRTLGVREGRLLPCPASPNCVSSFKGGEHGMDAVPHTGAPPEVMSAAVQVLTSFPRTTLLVREGNYAHFAARSPRLGFVDDVEVLVTGSHVHFRSASRLGYDDLGVNRKRMTRFTRRLREHFGGQL